MPKAEVDGAATDAEEPEAKVLGPIKSIRLHFGKVTLATQKRRERWAEIPGGTDFKTTLKPDYWAHHVRDITPLDTIELFCDDGLWEAKCRVMYVGRAEVRLSPIYYVEHNKTEVAETTKYETHYNGPAHRYIVRQQDDHTVVLKTHLQDKVAAEKWLQEYIKSLDA